MAKYRCVNLSFALGRIIQPDEVIELDGEVGANFELIDKPAKTTKAPSALDLEVGKLTSALRLKAASRGVSPEEVTEADFDALLKEVDPKPADAVVKAAAEALGVTLGSSVA